MRTVLRICVWAGVQTSMSLRPLPNLGQRRDADGRLSSRCPPTGSVAPRVNIPSPR